MYLLLVPAALAVDPVVECSSLLDRAAVSSDPAMEDPRLRAEEVAAPGRSTKDPLPTSPVRVWVAAVVQGWCLSVAV
jgi:hypothetical protein